MIWEKICLINIFLCDVGYNIYVYGKVYIVKVLWYGMNLVVLLFFVWYVYFYDVYFYKIFVEIYFGYICCVFDGCVEGG